MEIYWIVLAPLLAAFVAPRVCRLLGGRATGLLLSIVPFAIAGALIARAASGSVAEPIVWSHEWMPSLGVELTFMLGGFESLFLLLVSFIGGLILIYGGSYLHDDSQVGRFFAVVLLFMGAMLGVILADDYLLTFVFWELTSITSFILVGYKHYDLKARKAALQALLVTGGGGLALLAGLILVHQITGTARISELVQHSEQLTTHALFPGAFVLILLGIFTKSAQFPFHFWLPGAMAAPTPVSAYLHSATMVKAGVILLAKLAPSMSQAPLWAAVVPLFGAITMVTGAVLAILQTDLKRLLAYTTVSVLGTLVMLIGFGDPFSIKVALFLALVHGCYKGALFMVAGTVDHATGTRDIRHLSGLAKAVPLLAVAAGLAAVSMSGLPPTIGFISKELLYETSLDRESGRLWLTLAALVSNALAVGVAILVGVRPFLGKPGEKGVHHAPGLGMVIPPLVLAGLGLALGILPAFLDQGVVSPAADALGAGGSTAKLVLWHGFTLVLGLSGITLLLGIAAFAGRARLAAAAARLEGARAITPTALYDTLLNGTLAFAARVTKWIQNGQLRFYVRVTMGVSAGLIAYTLIHARGSFETTTTVPFGFFETAVLILLSASAIAAVRAKSRLSAILCLGGVGFSVALIFVAYGAPDLAITQILVETLTVVLFSFVILKLPQLRVISSNPWRLRWDAILSTFAGLAITAVVWKSIHVNLEQAISPGLVERSVTEAYGRNVVNVILVDFRALDTLGEILVLALAGIGVTALLARRRLTPRRLKTAPEPTEADSLHEP